MFAEEKPTLQALPLEPFRYCQYGKRTVHLDGCVEAEAAYYGAQPGGNRYRLDVELRNPAVFVANDILATIKLDDSSSANALRGPSLVCR